ncbi:MAG: LON peptidase substrate-binding domain-containing protein [Steroidobacteraceae bacterium]
MSDIALFPLNTVLFPGGLLPLRIFEPRYVDMVGCCMRANEAFGVVLALGGSDTDRQVETATVGSSARIVDFQTLEDGLLGILCRGERRFRVRSRSQQTDGLNRAEVEWLQEPAPAAVPDEFQPLLPVLRGALAQLKTIGHFVEPDYGDASWVSYRIAELLPLDPRLQQQLLESDDPPARLRLLAPLFDLRSQ